MSKEKRAGEHEHVVASEISVGLFAGDEEEVAVGEAPAALEIDFLLIQAKLARVARMRVGVEVGEDGDIDSEIAEYRQPCGLEVHRPSVSKLLVEVEVEMADQNLEAWHRLVNVIVRQCHHGLLGGSTVRRAQIKVDRHALQC